VFAGNCSLRRADLAAKNTIIYMREFNSMAISYGIYSSKYLSFLSQHADHYRWPIKGSKDAGIRLDCYTGAKGQIAS